LAQSVFAKEDRLAFAVAMPARVRSGSINRNAAADVNLQTGDPIYGVIPVSLRPDGRERRFELSWVSPVKAGHLTLSAMRRLEPNHNASAPAESVLGARFSTSW
jgi:hypothetical protein